MKGFNIYTNGLGFITLCLVLFFSCNNRIDERLLEKTKLLNSIDSVTFSGYQIVLMREDVKYPDYAVNRNDGTKEYAVICTKPEARIEKKFSINPIEISFVKEYGKLDCQALYYHEKFKRIDFSYKRKNIGFYQKRSRVILFKGTPSEGHKFLLNNSRIKQFHDEWKYLIIESE